MRVDGAVSGQPPAPRVSGRGGGGTPSPFPGRPYLSILSQLSDGFFTTAGMAGTGAALAPSMEQGSLRGQHSPSPNSGQGAGSVSRVPLTCPNSGGTRAGGGPAATFPPSLPARRRASPHTQIGGARGLAGRYRSSGPPGRAGWGR